MTKPYISAIAAVAKNNVIGRDNKLLWHTPEDLRHFKKTTLGKPVVMGRKTFESLGKPLSGRPNIVISRAASPAADHKDGSFFYFSIEDGIKAAKKMAAEMNVDEIFILGGGEIYKQTLAMTNRLYLTLIDREYEGDAFFPAIDRHEWKTVSEDRRAGDPPFTFLTLERK